MKPYYHIIFLCFFSSLSFSQIVSIPDANFKTALLNHTPAIDTNGDGEIQVSEASLVEKLHISGRNIPG